MCTNKKYILGLIGCGRMGIAIARGAVAKEYLERCQICVYDPDETVQATCRGEMFPLVNSEREVCQEAHIVLLAVEPQIIDVVLDAIRGEKIDCLLSIVTGVSIAHLQEKTGNAPVIRAMPNTPLQINEGATALCMSANCNADDYDFVFRLFNSMGVTRSIPEDKMNYTVAVHGSTPAYIYYFVECILRDVVSRGVDEDTARDLLVQTVIGAGELLKKYPEKPLENFINEVCSRGGTTIEAISELKKQNLDKIVHDANEKCIKRAIEIGK